MSFLTFIVPFYNDNEKYFKQLITSLNNQTCDDFSIVIINNGSNKKCTTFLESLKNKKTMVINLKENVGYGEARNIGIKSSKSEYIAFVDSDDWIAENYVEKIKEITRNKNYDFINIGFTFEYKNASVMKSIFNKKNKEINSREMSKKRVLITHTAAWTKVINRKFQQAKNLYFYKDRKNLIEDIYFSLKLIHLANVCFMLNEPLYCYRLRKKSTMKKLTSEWKYFLIFNENYKKILNDFSNNETRKLIFNHFYFCDHPIDKLFFWKVNSVFLFKLNIFEIAKLAFRDFYAIAKFLIRKIMRKCKYEEYDE